MTVAELITIGDLGRWALEYAEQGLQVFPLRHDKTPYDTANSQKSATTDPATIERWWTTWPTALIGHRIPPDEIVLDVDPRHNGHETWRALKAEIGGDMPITRAHASGRGDGGFHAHFKRPAERVNIAKLNAWARERGLGAPTDNGGWTCGIDILQHNHRYTILPPSPHPDTGRAYEWIDGRGRETSAAAMPVFLAELITAEPLEPKPAPGPRDPDSIADWYCENHTWSQILGSNGWTIVVGDGESDGSKWRHPNASAPSSATVRYGCLFVYSTNTVFQDTAPGEPHGYTKFAAYALLEHGPGKEGQSKAASAIRKERGEPTHDELMERWRQKRLAAAEHQDDQSVEEPPKRERGLLVIERIVDIAARVDAMSPPTFLAEPVWPSDAYGVLAAEDKAGKSWAALDLGIAVAGGTAWMDQFPIRTSGNVLMFLGEGSDRKTVRRARAVAAFHQVELEDLPLDICHRTPHLTSADHLAQIELQVEAIRPSLIVVDPLYLAAKGANAASLFEMAETFEPIQHLALDCGAALLLVHHWNQTGTGKDRKRMSGAGSAEWGRVLVSIAVAQRRTEPDQTSVVDLEWRFIGDEIPDTETLIRRRVHAVDQVDLSSPMTYSVETVQAPAPPAEWDGPTECAAACVELLERSGEAMSISRVRDLLDVEGIKFGRNTVTMACEIATKDGRLVERRGPRNGRVFQFAGRNEEVEFDAF